MSFFPQVGCRIGGKQFPVSRSRRWRAIVNQMESSEVIMLPDANAGQIQWKLSYQDLAAAEVQSLSNMFNASQGAFAPFTFIDPLANLLGWSEKVFRSRAWQVGLLHTAAGAPLIPWELRASSVTNLSPGTQALQQSLGVSGRLCRVFQCLPPEQHGRHGNTPAVMVMALAVALSSAWQRVFLNGKGAQRHCPIDLLRRFTGGAHDRSLGIAGGTAALPLRIQSDHRGSRDL